jgi:predicted phosphodiesterase
MENRTYNFRDNKIILIGDTHDQEILYDLINLRITNGSDVVFVGDGGIAFGVKDLAIKNTLSWLVALNRLCVRLDVNLYIIRGNHDATYPEIWDSKWTNIFLTKSGDVGVFPNGKKTLLVGGGISVDRCTRKTGVDYWPGELTPYLEDVEKCDIMFSHDCPEHFNHPSTSLSASFNWCVVQDATLIEEALKQRLNMTDIAKRSEVKTIWSGHFHNSKREEKDGVYYRCLGINELLEFDAELEYKL